jgi:beta-glucanase (GH16 family)
LSLVGLCLILAKSEPDAYHFPGLDTPKSQMRSVFLASASVAAVAFQLAAAQTFTKCDPLTKTCPADPALGGTQVIDFTKGESSAFNVTNGNITYGSLGAEFTIAQTGDSPTIQSNDYIFFGHIDVVMQVSPGTGIVTTIVLESDDLDEVDWEALGGDDAQIQTNYFGKGNTTTYDRGGFAAVTSPQTTFHTYSLDWTNERLEWSIDGKVVRTLNYGDAVGGKNYPQTPSTVRIGTWAAGDSSSPGTVSWAGGKTDYSKAPFTAYVKSVKIVDFSTGGCYTYGDNSGAYASIKSLPSSDPRCASADSRKSPASNSTSASGTPTATSNSTVNTSTASTTSTATGGLGSIIAAPFASNSSSAGSNSTSSNPPAASTTAAHSGASTLASLSTFVFGVTLAFAFVL